MLSSKSFSKSILIFIEKTVKQYFNVRLNMIRSYTLQIFDNILTGP